MIVMLSNGEYSGPTIVGIVDVPDALDLKVAHGEFVQEWQPSEDYRGLRGQDRVEGLRAQEAHENGIKDKLIKRYVPMEVQEKVTVERGIPIARWLRYTFEYIWEVLFM